VFNMKDVDAKKFIEVCKEELKKVEVVKPPAWATFAKTGQSRKFPPQQEDWWYTRTASILRRIYLDGPVGVQRLRTYYGSRKERGHKPQRFRRSGGSVLRKCLQQLELAGFIQKSQNAKKKGRIVSEEGKKFIRKIVLEAKK
jgi:small subunit ribosomal protein S19e